VFQFDQALAGRGDQRGYQLDEGRVTIARLGGTRLVRDRIDTLLELVVVQLECSGGLPDAMLARQLHCQFPKRIGNSGAPLRYVPPLGELPRGRRERRGHHSKLPAVHRLSSKIHGPDSHDSPSAELFHTRLPEGHGY
jgi:hypothetical protein